MQPDVVLIVFGAASALTMAMLCAAAAVTWVMRWLRGPGRTWAGRIEAAAMVALFGVAAGWAWRVIG